MPDSPGIRLLSPDHGIDASSPAYQDSVCAVVTSLGRTANPARARVDEHMQLAARSIDALNEVAEWANDGQSTDPTACAWLSYLRWARAQGAHPPASSPTPPAREFDLDFPLLSGVARPEGDSFAALATGEFGEVARPVNPDAYSAEVLTRSIPYGLIPRVGWKALIPLVVDAAAITHGVEAHTAAAATALAVHAGVLSRTTEGGVQDVLTEVHHVCAAMTRPAPRTRALLTLVAGPAQRRHLKSRDGSLSRALGTGTDAPSALALGLAAAAHADDTEEPTTPRDTYHRALALVSAHPAASRAAAAVAGAVIAARWGTDAVPSDEAPLSRELDRLAQQWIRRWCP